MDFGFLNSLQGRRNWGAIRQSKLDELGYQQQLNQIEQSKLDAQNKTEAETRQYLNIVNQLGLDDTGKKKVLAVSDEMKPAIAEGIKKYGGNLKKWFDVEGQGALDNYVMDLYNHPTTQREMKNALIVKHAEADDKLGLKPRDVYENGQLAPIDQQLKDREDGKRDVLKYNGGFKPGKATDKELEERYGHANHYLPREYGLDDYYTAKNQQFINEGLRPQDAAQQARESKQVYAQQLAAGSPLQYKSDKYTPQMALANLKLNKLSQDGGMSGTISYLAKVQNGTIGADSQLSDGSLYYQPHVEDMHGIVGAAGHEINEKTGGVKDVNTLGSRGNVYTDDFASPVSFVGVNPDDVSVIPTGVKHKNGKSYIHYKVSASKDALKGVYSKDKPVQGGWFSSNVSLPGGQKVNNLGKKGDKSGMAFNIWEEVPFNASTVAGQMIQSKESTKGGQEALQTGIIEQKMQLMDADALQDE